MRIVHCLLLYTHWVSAALISRPNSLVDSVAGKFNTSYGPENWQPECVTNRLNPSWAGQIDYNACAYAFAVLYMKTKPYGSHDKIFISKQFVPNPPENSWILPSGVFHSNCAVFARMARDFGDEALPVRSTGQYLPTNHARPVQVARWDTITEVMRHLLSSCVGNKGRPGWSARVGDIVVFFVPYDSAFRRRWWAEVAEIGGMNSTGLLSSS